MNLLFTVLAAFPLGLLVRRRQLAILTYLIVGSFLFTFQTLGVLLTWMSGGKGIGGGSGFGDAPVWIVPDRLRPRRGRGIWTRQPDHHPGGHRADPSWRAREGMARRPQNGHRRGLSTPKCR
jgi:hypothetical protein